MSLNLRTHSCNTRLFSSRGAMIPVIAVFATCVVAFISLLAVDATMVKYASTVLKHDLDELCKNSGQRPQFPSETIQDFQRLMQFWSTHTRPVRLNITSAKVFSPVAYGAANPAWANCGAMGLAAAGDGCRLNCGGGIDCRYIFNAYNYNSTTEGFPENFWIGNNGASMYENRPHIGTTVACEVTATYQTMVSGTRKLAARAAFFRTTRGGWGGYAVAVAPQLTTISQPWVNNPDSLSFDAGTLLGSGSGGFSLASVIGTAGSPGPLAQAFTGPHPDIATPFSVSTLGGPDTLSGHPGVLAFGFNQRDLLGGCLALPGLVRNGIASILFENLIRNAYTFEGATEVSVVNPMHEDVCNRGTAPAFDNGDYPSRANAPVQVMMSDGTVDPSSRSFQLPYITYDSGLTSTFNGCAGAPPAGRNKAGVFHNNGWINPWLSAGNVGNVLNSSAEPYTATLFAGTGASAAPPRSDWRHLHSLIAGQLRQCYSLSSAGMLGRLTLRVADTTGFEPAEKTSRLFLRGSSYSAGDPWDQSGTNPWSFGAGSSDALTVPEMLSIMGSAQSCPTRSACMRGGTTLLPTSQQDLQPDLYGFVRHFYIGGPGPNAGQVYNSFRPPGIFPFKQDSNGTAFLPDNPNRTVPFEALSLGGTSNDPTFTGTDDDRYSWSPATRGLTLFMHKPPSQAQAVLLEEYMDWASTVAGNAFPITIVYIPTNPDDAWFSTGVSSNGPPMDRIRFAFKVPDPDVKVPFDIYAHFRPKLYALTPFDSDLQGEASCSTRYPVAQPLVALRRYWSDLLRDPWAPPPADCPDLASIHSIARDIFSDRATAYMLRF